MPASSAATPSSNPRQGFRWKLGLALILVGLGIMIWSGLQSPPRARAIPFEVVAEYPHDPAAYTQGLVFHEGRLFESTGRYGESSLREVDIETGDVLRRVDLRDDYFGEGLCLWQNRWLQLTWRSEVVLQYDRETLEPLKTLKWPEEGWGLTHNGQSLFITDGSDRVFVADPETLDVQRVLEVTQEGRPVERLNELEFIEGFLYANVWYRRHVLKIDPQTGEVVGQIDFEPQSQQLRLQDSDAVMNGIAYDPDTRTVYLTGKLWPKLFAIRLQE